RHAVHRLDHSGLLAGGQLPAYLGQFDENHVAKGVLRMVGDADGDSAIGFQARPLMAGGVTQISGDSAHVMSSLVAISPMIKSVLYRGAQIARAQPVRETICREFPLPPARRWPSVRAPVRWICPGSAQSCRW